MSAKIMQFPEQETTISDLIKRGDRIPAYRVPDQHHRRAHHPELSLVDRVRRTGITR